nr:AAC-rich mRNA clone AAC11 protein-like [Procambarus clarkii]
MPLNATTKTLSRLFCVERPHSVAHQGHRGGNRRLEPQAEGPGPTRDSTPPAGRDGVHSDGNESPKLAKILSEQSLHEFKRHTIQGHIRYRAALVRDSDGTTVPRERKRAPIITGHELPIDSSGVKLNKCPIGGQQLEPVHIGNTHTQHIQQDNLKGYLEVTLSGDKSRGDNSSGINSNGDNSSGVNSNGDNSSGINSNGDNSSGVNSNDDNSIGDKSRDDRSSLHYSNSYK